MIKFTNFKKLNTLIFVPILVGFLVACQAKEHDVERRMASTPSSLKSTEMIEVEVVNNSFQLHEGFRFSEDKPIDFESIIEECSNERSHLALRGNVYSCSPSYLVADACWRAPIIGQIYCAEFPWGGVVKTYLLSENKNLPELISNPDSIPIPWGIELETGLRCRIRSGGGWNTRKDGLIPYYRCDDDSNFIVGESPASIFNKDSIIWTAKIATTGNLEDSNIEPKKIKISKAWFAVDY
jgi:lipoprotein